MRYLLFLVSSKNFVFCKLPLEWLVTLRLCADLLISADKISKFSPHRQEHITKNFKMKKNYLNVSNEWNKMWRNVIYIIKMIKYILENLVVYLYLCINKIFKQPIHIYNSYNRKMLNDIILKKLSPDYATCLFLRVRSQHTILQYHYQLSLLLHYYNISSYILYLFLCV